MSVSPVLAYKCTSCRIEVYYIITNLLSRNNNISSDNICNRISISLKTAEHLMMSLLICVGVIESNAK
jgi:hypothetical protein